MKKFDLSQPNFDKILHDTQNVLAKLRKQMIHDPENITDAIKILKNIRHEVYEDLNQIQHEYLIICAAQWLQKNENIPQEVTWFWNPRQTGNSDEPDLACDSKGSRIISAEITTSKNPKGSIDKRMRETLLKLDQFEGKKFYFVQTDSMSRRAKGKVNSNSLDIKVVFLHDEE